MDQPVIQPPPEQPLIEDPISASTLKRLRLVVLVLALLAIAYRASSTIVSEGTSAIVVRLGNPTRVLDAPGLYVTLPWPVRRGRYNRQKTTDISNPTH